MGTLAQNLRYAIRTLRNYPGFALVVVLTLALGIGANTAIFSVVYSALLRPLPYREPGKLYHFGESRIQNDNSTNGAQASYPDYLDWKRTAKSVQSFAGYSGDAFTLSANGEPKNTFALQVTPNFFSTLGVRPALGRDFLENEMQVEDDPHVAILTDAFWRTELGADPNIAGRVIHLNGKPVTIIGVLPRDFEFAPAGNAQLWVPIHQTGDPITRRSLRWLSVFGRLAPGFSPDQVRAEMQGINAQLATQYPKENSATFFVMETLTQNIVGKVRPILLILLGAVGFVLLITCGNVANLLLTRSIGRRKEFAVRSALGASRASLLSQLLTESLLLSFIGAGVGLLGAQWGVPLLVAGIPESQLQAMPYLRTAGINFPVLVFLCGVAVVTGHARLRNTLVVAEISISLVLLVGAGLLLKSLHTLLGQDPGFNLHNVLSFSVNLPDSSYPSDKTPPYYSDAALRFDHEFTHRLRSLPGVLDVGQASAIPVSGGRGTIRFVVEGRATALGQEDECQIMTVSTGYFTSLKIPLSYPHRLHSQRPGALHVPELYGPHGGPAGRVRGSCPCCLEGNGRTTTTDPTAVARRGSRAISLCFPEALSFLPDWMFCPAGVDSCCGWFVRADRTPGATAHSGDRHPRCTGCATQGHFANGSSSRNSRHSRRSRRRHRRRPRAHASHEQFALRRKSGRLVHICERLFSDVCGRACSMLGARVPRHESRSPSSIEVRINHGSANHKRTMKIDATCPLKIERL